MRHFPTLVTRHLPLLTILFLFPCSATLDDGGPTTPAAPLTQPRGPTDDCHWECFKTVDDCVRECPHQGGEDCRINCSGDAQACADKCPK